MMESLRWHTIVAAAIILFCATPLSAQNPLEQLEAKLLEQEKLEASKLSGPKTSPDQSSENLPGLKDKPGKGILVNPLSPVSPPIKSNLPSKVAPEQALDAEPPYLGMTLERPVGGGIGLRVVEVVNQSPAWKSGFRVDDRILAIAGTAVSDIDAFAGEISKFAPNELIKFLVERRGRQMDINVVLIPRSIAAKTIPNATIPPSVTPRSNPTKPRTPQSTEGQGSLGLILAPLSDAFRRQFGIPVFRGASVVEVVPDSPGFMAGLAPGDCIVDIDGTTIHSDDDVVRWKQAAPPKAVYSLGFYRGAQLMQSTIQLTQAQRGSLTLGAPNANPEQITSDMLTPEYIQRLQVELSELRNELKRSQERIQLLENAINRSR